jgi:hypothetical protein
MKIIDNLNFQSNQSMRGGTREGAGRPKGSVGIKTKIRQQMIKAADDGELMPLDFMLQTLRDEEQDFAIRYKAAVDAAPYLHPRLAATAVPGPVNGGIAELLEIVGRNTRRIPSQSDN